MSTEIGKEALFSDNKYYDEDNRRIYLGTFNGTHLSVSSGYEKDFEAGKYFSVTTWGHMKDLPKPKEKRWLWLKDRNGYTTTSDNYLTDKFAEDNNYVKDKWHKSDMFIEVKVK